MDFNVVRFQSPVNPDLICFFCKNVPEDPVIVKCCETLFCNQCIREWLQSSDYCPADCQHIDESNLKKAPIVLTNLINDLDISCGFYSKGCQVIVKMRDLMHHYKECDFNPRKGDAEKKCKNCDILLIQREGDVFEPHSCSPFLLSVITEAKDENKLITKVLQKQVKVNEEMRSDLVQVKGDNNQLKESVEKKKADINLLMKRVESMEEKRKIRDQEWDEMRNALKEMESKVKKSSVQKKAVSFSPKVLEYPSFPVSREHLDMIDKLRRKGLITSDKVLEAMEAIDSENYANDYNRYEILKDTAMYLDKMAPHLKGGFKVLQIINSRSYVFPCLALMVGSKGSVAGFISSSISIKMIDRDHAFFLASKRLTLLSEDREEKKNDVIIALHSVGSLKLYQLTKQLSPGGLIVDENGNILLRNV